MLVLVAEDNANDRKILRLSLEKHGNRVIEAVDGEEALALAMENVPDLIVSDALMPRLDGFELLRAVKKNKRLAAVPFVFYSAVYTGKKEEDLALSLGADAFLIKPIEPERLWEQLQKILLRITLETPERPVGLMPEEEDFLRKYSQVVATKLEEKVRELERAKAKIEADAIRLRQAQRLEAIGTLAGGIAHDFNNLLFPILAYTEMVMEQLPPTSRAHQDLDEVYKAAQRARELVGQILSFSRETELERTPVSLKPLVKECLKFLHASLPGNIRIIQNLEAQNDLILGDPTQVHQVLMNLATNAYQAMAAQGGELRIALRNVELGKTDFGPGAKKLEPGSYVQVAVKDTGCGMDQSLLEKIFDPYFTT
ncbi:MAG: hybrid sensor histidine kinase/response regulator, partial [Desulfobacteraceae bacterium]